MVSTKGLSVFECKNYTGYVYGSSEKTPWTYYLSGNKYHFYNPLKQNEGHIKALHSLIDFDDTQVTSCVIFNGYSKLKVDYDCSKYILGQIDTATCLVKEDYLNKNDQFTDQQGEEIYKKLLPYTNQDKAIKEAHIQQIKKNKSGYR